MGFTNGRLLGRIAEIAIVAFAVIIAVNQIGIATNLVDTLFIGVVAALALAFGLAFGLGGREVASQLTQDWYAQMQSTAARVQAHVDETAAEPAAPRTSEGPATGNPATGSSAG